MDELSPREAQTALFAAHGFASQKQGIEGTREICLRHPCIQVDPIEVAGRNADLTLQSRVADYRRKYLYDLLYERHHLFEYFCKMMSILPVEAYPIFRHKMERFEKKVAPFFRKNKDKVKDVLEALEAGPVSSRELTGMGKTEWSWGRNTRISNIILTRLWVAGKALVHHREGRRRYYSLPEDVLPQRILTMSPPQKSEEKKEIARLIAKASRLVSPSKAPEQWYEVGKTKDVRRVLEELEREGELFSLTIRGWRGTLYAPREDRDLWEDPPHIPGLRFLAPLDPLSWNRALFEKIYGKKYTWEVYKKVEEREYGYYTLPVIFDGAYVALIEPFFRKEDKTLEIKGLHVLESRLERRKFMNALECELQRFKTNLGAEDTVVTTEHRWLSTLQK